MRYMLMILPGLSHWGAMAVLCFAGFFVGAFACDEACDGFGDWSRNPDAWQWDGMKALAVGLLLAVTALIVMLVRRRPRPAELLYAAQLGIALALLALVGSADLVTIAPPLIVLGVAAQTCGLAAVWLSGSRLV